MRNKYEPKGSSIKIFVSSSMVDELHLARRAAIHAFFERMPMYDCFLIEETASPLDVESRFLDMVLNSEVIILVLSDKLRKAVQQEYQVALREKKRIFAFIQIGITDQPLNDFIKLEIEKNVYFTTFSDLRDLIDKIEKSLLEDMANSYRKWMLYEAKQKKPYVDKV